MKRTKQNSRTDFWAILSKSNCLKSEFLDDQRIKPRRSVASPSQCRVHKGTGLDDNNRNLKSFPIHCNVHDNPLIEPGEMQYYAKIEGTDRFTNHDSNLKGIHPWVNSIFAANNIPSLKSVSYTPRPKPINKPQCNCSRT